jgi:glycosyltransferase involved in cell wall biosynthesis
MKQTNILHVLASMDPRLGGVCEAVRTMIIGLAARNVRNEVVCLDATAAVNRNKEALLIHALGPGKGPWCFSARLVSWLVENLPRFDALVVHGLWLYPGFAVQKALLINKRKTAGREKVPRLFVMPHGMLDPYFQRAPERKLKALRNWLFWKLIENKLIHQADGVLFTCEEERRRAREPFSPYQPRQEIVVGLGVAEPPAYTSDLRKAFLRKCPGLLNRPYLLFLSRIHPKKGVDLLIKAYSEIWAKNASALPAVSGTDAGAWQGLPVLVIAGPGLDTPYGEAIQKLAAESKACPVFFPGMLSGAAKWGAFYGCEAFVLPSHQENFGIAVVEALACKKVVLISKKVNIWREIDASGGSMTADDTLAGTRALLERWGQLSSQDKRELGQQARGCFEKCFAADPATTRILQALGNL